MPIYDITACLGDVSCELLYHNLTKTNELLLILQQVDIVGKGLLVGFLAMVGVILVWNGLKAII